MQRNMNRQEPQDTRRTFLKSSGALAAGLYVAGGSAAKAANRAKPGPETLAIKGGSKAVTVSHSDSTKWPRYGKEEKEAVLELIDRPGYGPLAPLEQEWKEYYKTPYCKAHFNGTSALTSAWCAFNLPPGSEVLTPSLHAWFGIVPMRFFGLVPVFMDSKPRTLNFDVEDAKRRLTKNTKALFPVHLFGLPCEMDAICDFAKEKGLLVLEDACHAHNATLQGKLMGNWGDIGAFSFQCSKIIPGIEGGVANYKSKEHYDRATALGHYGKCSGNYAGYAGTGLGMKLRIHPMAAALVRCGLKKMPVYTVKERLQMGRLNDRLEQLPGLYMQTVRHDMKRVCWAGNHLFVDPAKAGMSREACVKALKAEGVSIRRFSYSVNHKRKIYQEAKWWHHPPVIPQQLPGVDEALRTGITLPRFTKDVPELIDQYVKAFEKVWAHRNELA